MSYAEYRQACMQALVAALNAPGSPQFYELAAKLAELHDLADQDVDQQDVERIGYTFDQLIAGMRDEAQPC